MFPLLVTGAAALIFTTRCAFVTHGDIEMASILLSQSTLGDAIRALWFVVGPAMLAILSALFLVAAAGQDRLFGPRALGLLAAGAVILALHTYTSPSAWQENFSVYLLFVGGNRIVAALFEMASKA